MRRKTTNNLFRPMQGSFSDFFPQFRMPRVEFKRTWIVKPVKYFPIANEVIYEFEVIRKDYATCFVHFHVRQHEHCYWTVGSYETQYPIKYMRRLINRIDEALTENANYHKAVVIGCF